MVKEAWKLWCAVRVGTRLVGSAKATGARVRFPQPLEHVDEDNIR